jgi:hypothetical protein
MPIVVIKLTATTSLWDYDFSQQSVLTMKCQERAKTGAVEAVSLLQHSELIHHPLRLCQLAWWTTLLS